MKLYIMKKEALELLKENLPNIYGKYYTEKTNKWIWDIYGDDPFIEYKDVTDFKLADLDSDLTPGEIDLNNCKIIYKNLMFLSESQAVDERLWAGLTHSTFYEYMRKRWRYGYEKKPKDAKTETGEIKTRFFYNKSGRSGYYRNTLAKCWWVGRNTYDPSNFNNHFEALDILGSNDFNSKISEIFFNFTFSSNADILKAIIEALRNFKNEGRHLLVRDHIRPALTYLNAVGGSVVLDCLEKEEITDIFTDAIEANMQGDTPSLSLDRSADEDADAEDFADEANDNGTESGTVEVTLGCLIIVRNLENNGTKRFKYDYANGRWLEILNVFSHRKVGDTIELSGEKWIIEEILLK